VTTSVTFSEIFAISERLRHRLAFGDAADAACTCLDEMLCKDVGFFRVRN
jgi:hypothetical protein